MKHLITVILVSFIMSFLCGCKQTEYVEVPVETVKIEYKVKKDSIYLRDSINVFTEVKGDTVYYTKVKYQLKEVVKNDTVLKIDSIPVVIEIPKAVEVNRLYTWQKALMYLGGVGVILLLGFIINKIKIWKLLF